MGVLDRAAPVGDTEEYIKLLLYGPPGVGKTYFCGHAPKPIFVDFERSTETLRHHPELRKVPVVRPDTVSDIIEIVKELPKSDYETVIFDTVSRMQTFQLRQHMEGVEKKDKRDRLLPLFQDYRISTSLLDEIFTDLQDMPINVVFVAHATTREDDETKVVMTRPDLTPQLSRQLTGLINVIGYLNVNVSLRGEVTRSMQINPTNRVIAKNRLGITEKEINNPTWETVFTRSK